MKRKKKICFVHFDFEFLFPTFSLSPVSLLFPPLPSLFLTSFPFFLNLTLSYHPSLFPPILTSLALPFPQTSPLTAACRTGAPWTYNLRLNLRAKRHRTCSTYSIVRISEVLVGALYREIKALHILQFSTIFRVYQCLLTLF